jgi:alpha-ketoglutarate-dependent 2,4-dichlorophenoxyacetate dioxygenase
MGQEPEFKHIKITKLHPTFGAEVSGVDFSRPLSDEVFQETQGAMAKVRTEASSQG